MRSLGLSGFGGAVSLIAVACVGSVSGGDEGGADAQVLVPDSSTGDTGDAGPIDGAIGGDAAPDAAPADYDWMAHIDFYEIAATGFSCNEAQYGHHYCDVMGHTQDPYLSADLLTNVHETQHFMLHENDGATPEADKFIYWRDGNGAFFLEPETVTSDVVQYISHQYTVYDTYIAERPSQPLGENMFDEWCAYLTEEIVAIQMAHLEGQTSNVEGLVVASVEFMYYAAAALHALAVEEPSYLEDNPQALAIYAMLAEGTKEWTIDQGIEVDLFSSWANDRAEGELDDFRNSADNEDIRQTLRDLYSDAWTNRVLGF